MIDGLFLTPIRKVPNDDPMKKLERTFISLVDLESKIDINIGKHNSIKFEDGRIYFAMNKKHKNRLILFYKPILKNKKIMINIGIIGGSGYTGN
jgi:predicted protein tyrosine phosphatase